MLEPLRVMVRNFVRSRGYDLVRTPNLQAFLDARGVDLVVDVGANTGTYGKTLRRWGYRGHIVSLEPTKRAFADLEAAATRDGNWKAFNLGAGDAYGDAVINVAKNDEFSSILPMTQAGVDYDPLAAIDHQETIRIVTLDKLMADCQARAPFLKIDTQGFERQVLDGAPSFLSRCVGVQLELPIQHLYQGVWSFRDALEVMEDLGFEYAQSTPTNPRHDDWSSVAELDCVFRRITPS